MPTMRRPTTRWGRVALRMANDPKAEPEAREEAREVAAKAKAGLDAINRRPAPKPG